MDKRLVLALAIIAALILLTSGCCSPIDDIFSGPKPSPTITATFKPTPTPRPTPTPTPIVVPTIVPQRSSRDVKLLAAPYEYQCRFIRNEMGQSENLTILLVNNNDTVIAKNVVLVVTVEDYTMGTTLYSGEMEYGDLAPGEQRLVQVRTPAHEMASPIYIRITIEWGLYREFYFKEAYKNSFTYISSAVYP